MRIDGIDGSPGLQNLPEKSQGKEKAKGAEGAKKDSLELSSEVRKPDDSDHLLPAAQNRLSSIPDIRQEKVDEIRGKLASKYYEQDQVILDIAEKLSRSSELAHALARENKQAADVEPEDVKKLSVIFNRIDRGFYDSEKVLKTIAEKLKENLSGEADE